MQVTRPRYEPTLPFSLPPSIYNFVRLQISPLKFAPLQLIRYQVGRAEFLRLQPI